MNDCGQAGLRLTHTIDKWLGVERSCVCGVAHVVRTRLVRLDDHDGRHLAEVAGAIAPDGAVLLAVSPAVQSQCQYAAEALNRAGRTVTRHLLVDSSADESACESLVEAIRRAGAGLLVGCGSGTLNDICKFAATRCERPYICCPTAASMNGYPSTIAALKRNGLKVTDPVAAPVAIIGDPGVYAAAPAAMSAAGFADLLSKYTSNADWRMARQLEGAYYCERPSKLAAMAAEEAVGVVDEIRAGESDAIVTLMEASVLSGLAMAIAGSSAPSSGAEHLISHYWDMIAPATGGWRYHGTQVGIGVLIVAALYEMLREIEPRQIQPEAIAEVSPSPEEWQDALEDHFGDLVEPVIEQSLAKMLTPKGIRTRASQIRDTWPVIKQDILNTVPSRKHLADLLSRAGAPTTAGQLGVTREQVIDALIWSRHIRSRYTAFDFANDIGAFTPQHRAEILERSGVLREA